MALCIEVSCLVDISAGAPCGEKKGLITPVTLQQVLNSKVGRHIRYYVTDKSIFGKELKKLLWLKVLFRFDGAVVLYTGLKNTVHIYSSIVQR